MNILFRIIAILSMILSVPTILAETSRYAVICDQLDIWEDEYEAAVYAPYVWAYEYRGVVPATYDYYFHYYEYERFKRIAQLELLIDDAYYELDHLNIYSLRNSAKKMVYICGKRPAESV